MKTILGLDLGSNSIGWAVVKVNDEGYCNGISGAGSRILPMDAAQLSDFAKGNSVSQTRDRTQYRGTRRLLERYLLRRERLNRVLGLLGFLPEHYSNALTRYGKFKDNCEVKLAWAKNKDGKYEFLFNDSFREMLEEFKQYDSEPIANGTRIPYDWTIYYLRKKALTQALSKQELAWILLNFNQKRGYNQIRGEEETDDKSKRVEYLPLKVVQVNDTGDKKGKETWFDVILENGMVYHRTALEAPGWVGQTKDFIVTTPLDKDGNPKEGKQPSLRLPKEDDWTLIKKKTEADIEKSGMTVGAFIYDALLHNPTQKIKGKLVRTVERKFYKQELEAILASQSRFIPELTNDALYDKCINALYQSNEAYRNSISKRGFTYLFVDDIIFYQRPLKTKKSLIANCPYEHHDVVDKETGEIKQFSIKCIAKSNPIYQEFRLWQFVSNLRIYQREMHIGDILKTDVDVTGEFLKSDEDYARLFEYCNDNEAITQDNLLSKFFNIKKPKGKDAVMPYRWNYPEEKKLSGNETRGAILKHLQKCGINSDFLTKENEARLWHILYSIEDKAELKKALENFAQKHELSEEFVEVFSHFPPFAKDYGAYSEKAIKRLLPLMRHGKYWNVESIDEHTQTRINQLITGECDDNAMERRVKEKLSTLTDINQFRGQPLWIACYAVYGRHSEASDTTKWTSPADIDVYLKDFKQHSLRNPIVEQVVTETLRTVRDIWKQYGKIDEIHIELGRDMKNPAGKRAEISKRISDNENANLRIKALLTEFMNPEFGIDNVHPYSPSQQELLRIYEDGALNSVDEVPDDISDIIKKFSQTDIKKRPTPNEVLRYKLWMEQNYCSPYTGRPIPLGKLFTTAYQTEHVIPKKRYFDDSLSNKVICESEVNTLKDAMLGMEFIKKHGGEIVTLNGGKTVKILSVKEYEMLIQKNYKHNRTKMKKLLMDDIPDGFIERQMNDSRYISRFVKSLLSHIVREDDELEATSKNIISTTGGITDRLKKDWGVNDVWNHIVLPRFQRLNKLTETKKFTAISTNGHEIPAMPLELQRGFNKKRIDHRHHAMDAIVIACANRNIVNYLNNESACKGAAIKRKDLKYLLCKKDKNAIDLPWQSFHKDMYNALQNIVVSFNQNLRVINKTTNVYLHFKDGKKVLERQTQGDSWAIRKQMHKETYYGEVNLRKVKEVSLKEAIKNPQRIVDKDVKEKLKELLAAKWNNKQIKEYFEHHKDVWSDIKLKKIKVYYFTKETSNRFFATKKPIIGNFGSTKSSNVEAKEEIRKNIISSVTDTGIQKIMLNHLDRYNDKPNEAFSPDGVEEMNKHITELNNGKRHQPIYKVRCCEMANKFPVGQKGNKSSKFVEAAKGTNLFFAVYEKEVENKKTGNTERVRSFATIPLNVVIERQKQGLPSAPANEDGVMPKFVLSPNDLVYVPKPEEIEQGHVYELFDKERIYKMVSANKFQAFFIKSNVAKSIVDKFEFSPLNKMERAITGEMIKEICLPIKVDRLGNITIEDKTI